MKNTVQTFENSDGGGGELSPDSEKKKKKKDSPWGNGNHTTLGRVKGRLHKTRSSEEVGPESTRQLHEKQDHGD